MATSPSPDKSLFYAFVALLVWLPLPLASEPAFAWALMVCWSSILLLCWAWLFLRGKARGTNTLYAARFVLVGFGVWLVYVSLQLIPLPAAALSFLSPRSLAHWVESYELLGLNIPSTASISVDPKITKVGLLLSVSIFSVFFLTMALVTNRRRLKILAYALVLSGVFQAVYGAMMTLSSLEYGFFIEKTKYLGVATGTFFNRNHLAGYLEMTIAVGIGLLIGMMRTQAGVSSLKRKALNFLVLLLGPKARLRLALVLMVIGLILTHSRMGNTAFFTSLVVAGSIFLALSKKRSKSMVILFASLISIDVLLVGQWFGFEEVRERLENTTEMSENRDEVYEYGLQQWRDYPLTGSGLRSFYTVFPQYRGADVVGFNREAHNDYLQFATETGAIGLLLLGGICVASVGAALLAQRRRKDALMRGISFACIMGVIAILIHSLVDFNLQMPANAATFVVLLAFGWLSLSLNSRPDKEPEEQNGSKQQYRRLLAAMTICGSLSVIVLAGKWGMADVYYRPASLLIQNWITSNRELSEDHWKKLQDTLQTALALDPSNPEIHERMAIALAGRFSNLPPGSDQAQAAREAALSHYRKSASLRPSWPYVWNSIMLTKFQLNQIDQEFFDAYFRADSLGAWEPDIQQRLVDVGLIKFMQFSRKQRDSIMEIVARAAQKRPYETLRIAEAHGLRDVICLLHGDKEQVKRYCS